MTSSLLRVATYNVHKCQGLDGRVRPERIARVLHEVNADIVAIQEVLRLPGRSAQEDQVSYLAGELGFHWVMGDNRQLRGGPYGNATLSRLPLHASENHDLSVSGREPRGALRVDVEWPGHGMLHVFNVHLGTAFLERRHQARRMITDACLRDTAVRGPRIVLGDFNEWTQGLASRLLGECLQGPNLRARLPFLGSYPGVLPFLHLDHIYYDAQIEAIHVRLHRSRTALVASDHLPLVADFRWVSPGPSEAGRE